MSAKTVSDRASYQEMLKRVPSEDVQQILVLCILEVCRRAELEDAAKASITAKALGDAIGAIGAYHGNFDGIRECMRAWAADDEVWAELEPLGKETA